ncbi:hypothetical protein HDV01_001301, partial [Terramyces sp. JEL0728]
MDQDLNKIVIPVRTISRIIKPNRTQPNPDRNKIDNELEVKIKDSIKRITSLKGPNFLNEKENRLDNLRSNSDLSLKSNGVESLSSDGSNKIDTAFSPSRLFDDDLKPGLKVLDSDFLQQAMEGKNDFMKGNFVIPKRKSSANINSAGSTLHNLHYEPPVPPLNVNKGFKTFTQSNESSYKTFTQLPAEEAQEKGSEEDIVKVETEIQTTKAAIQKIKDKIQEETPVPTMETVEDQPRFVVDEAELVSLSEIEVEQESIISFSNAASAVSANQTTNNAESEKEAVKQRIVIPSRKESLAPTAVASPINSPLSNVTSPLVSPDSTTVASPVETSENKPYYPGVISDDARPFSFASSANFNVNTNLVNRHPLEPRIMPGYEKEAVTSPLYQNRNQAIAQSHMNQVVTAEVETDDVRSSVAVVSLEYQAQQIPPENQLSVQDEKVSSIYSKSRKILNNLMSKAEGVEVSKLLFGKKEEVKKETVVENSLLNYKNSHSPNMIPIQDVSQLPPGAVPIQSLSPHIA